MKFYNKWQKKVGQIILKLSWVVNAFICRQFYIHSSLVQYNNEHISAQKSDAMRIIYKQNHQDYGLFNKFPTNSPNLSLDHEGEIVPLVSTGGTTH